MSRSLRSRLVRSVLAAVALLLATFGLAVYLLFWWSLTKESETGLAATAQALARYAQVSRGQVTIDAEIEDFRQFAATSRRGFYQFWDAEGKSLYRSPSLRGRDMPRYACLPNGKPAFYTATLPTGRPGRALAQQFQPRPDDRGSGGSSPLTLVVANDTHELDERMIRLALLLGGAGAATMLTATLVAAWAVKRGLLPVGAVTAGIEAVHADGLHQRVPTEDIPTELAPVAE
ncbi:MAG: sensor histidine kinase N-terminal domain-containing protein, partial [Planctomycetota bacterium]|nr:sensor histidine kinase N-terminal domain-containing protein [Planctomycetota bacterium]